MCSTIIMSSFFKYGSDYTELSKIIIITIKSVGSKKHTIYFYKTRNILNSFFAQVILLYLLVQIIIFIIAYYIFVISILNILQIFNFIGSMHLKKKNID